MKHPGFLVLGYCDGWERELRHHLPNDDMTIALATLFLGRFSQGAT
jgi:hypothetical protein